MLISQAQRPAAIARLLKAYTGQRLNRRGFLHHAMAAGLSLSAASLLLASCDENHSYTANAIDVLNVWSGEEQNSFKAVVAPFTQTTGIAINVEATRNLDAALNQRLNDADPPDVAVIPNPDKLRQMASQNQLIHLDTFLNMPELQQNYASDWLNFASYQGHLCALVYKATNKGTIWYNPTHFHVQGYQPPAHWDDLLALSNTIAHHGQYPWTLGVKNIPVSGWPAADWVAEIYLKQSGNELYDQWVNHQIPWTHPSVQQAFRLFGQIVGGKHYIAGAPQTVLTTSYDVASYQLFTNPPQAYMDYMGDFASGFITNHFPQAQPGSDFNFFPFPTLDPKYADAVTVGADLVVAMRDTENVRKFMNYLATAASQTILVKRGGANSIHKGVDLADYPNDVARSSASMLVKATILRFGAGDVMPFVVEQAFWKGLLAFIAEPDQLDTILRTIELVAKQAYEGNN